jgi:hypothetical protein
MENLPTMVKLSQNIMVKPPITIWFYHGKTTHYFCKGPSSHLTLKMSKIIIFFSKHQMGLIFQKCILLVDTKCHVKNKIVLRKVFFSPSTQVYVQGNMGLKTSTYVFNCT